MEQIWFEMVDLQKKSFNKSVWIPLRACFYKEKVGKYGYCGYKQDFFGCGSIATLTSEKEFIGKLNWDDIGICHNHSGSYYDGKYTPVDIYEDYKSEAKGIHLVLEQASISEYPMTWHLHQDIVITLDLQRDGDSWISPKDGYIEVARLKKNDNGNPLLLEIKAQYLKDYLCARDMGLYITSFFSRDVIVDDDSFITWENGEEHKTTGLSRWEGRVIPIHEGGGEPYGEKMAVFHVSRTDIDETDDIPEISGIPTDENTKSESWEKSFKGRKIYRIIGDFWSNEWIDPGQNSPKIKGDKVNSTVFFIVDTEGNKVQGDTLIDSGKWLWFKPDVIMALSNRRGGFLQFYSKNTGSVACSNGYNVHFGINSLGYINVYAKDICILPDWQQQVWAGYNSNPEGGISDELLASQVRAEPASTQAPEKFFRSTIELLNKITNEKLNFSLFREHDVISDLLNKVHRFRAIDQAGLYALAKDIARLTADSLDAGAMQKIVSPPKGTEWGSLKSLENLLASKIDRNNARKITSSLVGIYELRLADAHLPSTKIDDSFKLINIDRNLPMIFQAHQMLNACVSSLAEIYDVFKKHF